MSEITTHGTEWNEYETSSARFEYLNIERDGQPLTIPITNIDHPEFSEFWDADRVYVLDDKIVAETERPDGTVWSIEENDRGLPDGDIGFDGNIVENPTDVEVADRILWERNA